MVRKKNTGFRLTLIKNCGVCGAEFSTTAASPFIRSIVTFDENEKRKYKTTYYCCQSCFKASYKYDMFANQIEKKKERDAKRVGTQKEKERHKRYYQEHREEILARHKRYYYEHYDEMKEINRFNRMKRRTQNG